VSVAPPAVQAMRRAIWTQLNPLEQLASALDDDLWDIEPPSAQADPRPG